MSIHVLYIFLGKFDPFKGYMYIDRICYRLPSKIATMTTCGETIKQLKRKHHLQRSLTPHLDCCPHNMHREGSKWRPIQGKSYLSNTNIIIDYYDYSII